VYLFFLEIEVSTFVCPLANMGQSNYVRYRYLSIFVLNNGSQKLMQVNMRIFELLEFHPDSPDFMGNHIIRNHDPVVFPQKRSPKSIACKTRKLIYVEVEVLLGNPHRILIQLRPIDRDSPGILPFREFFL